MWYSKTSSGVGIYIGKYWNRLASRWLRITRSQTGPGWLVFGTGQPESPFFVVAAGRPTFWRPTNAPAVSPIHLAFRAPSREAVDLFHATGLRCGATNNGDPGLRRGRYYCAFLIDFDGNNIEAGVYG